jgi:protein AroM
MAVKVGFVTIGQSPRTDVVPEIARILGPEVRILEIGALDGLSGREIRNLKPEKGDFRLITRLKNGLTVVVGKNKILPRLKKKIVELAGLDVRLIALLCTDEFPSIRQQRGSRVIMLQPYRLLRNEAVARLKEGKLGVFVPLEGQIERTKRKWEKTGLRVVVEALNPYQEGPEHVRAIESMKGQDAGLVVLDCIGYSKATKNRLQRVLDRPVLLPRAVLASAIKKWLSGQNQRTGRSDSNQE